MNILFSKNLKSAAKQSLQKAANNPKTLALIHAAIASGATLVLSLLDLFLSEQIGATGGLSGMGLRAVLSTARSTLSIAVSIALPFWEMGFLYACLQFARGQYADFSSLTEGFRRFGPILRLTLIQSAIYIAVIILAVQLGSMIFLMTPLSAEMASIFLSTPEMELTEELLSSMMAAATPLYLIVGVLCCLLLIPIAYRFRMADFYLLDGSHRRALVALGVSNRLMTGNRLSLFKLDVSFWWYYGGIFLLALIANADMVIPMSEGVSFLVYGLYLAGQILLSWLGASYVQTTYAHAYDALSAASADAEKPLVKNFPWGFLPDHE